MCLLLVVVHFAGCERSIEGWATVYDESFTLYSIEAACRDPGTHDKRFVVVDSIRVDEGVLLGDRLYEVREPCTRTRIVGRLETSRTDFGHPLVRGVEKMESFDEAAFRWVTVPSR